MDSETSFDTLIGNIDFEGPSPDEIALLWGCRDYGSMVLKGSDANYVIIEESNKKIS